MRLLLVEDDEKLARSLRKGLQSEGYAVDVVSDGDAALLNANVWDYDAIVLDVMLPGANGFEVCRALRAREQWAPVLMLTARAAVDDRVAGLDAGADDYLTKPFELRELLARVRALVRRRPTERPARIDIGDLSIDPATHAVVRAGTAVSLTPREFALIEFLAAHAGQVISRTRLLDHLWDANYMGSTNIVDVYVAHLRKKLEQPFGRSLIRTVRGVGFVVDRDS
jgi:two-component system OmpR family response regulator